MKHNSQDEPDREEELLLSSFESAKPETSEETSTEDSSRIEEDSRLRDSGNTMHPEIMEGEPEPKPARSGFFQWLSRVRIPRGKIVGNGSHNDGVFANLMAKPSAEPVEESLPSYDEVLQDATPPYWESTVLTPGYEDEVFVDGLPVGGAVNFLWNLMVSATFSFVGFVLTYLLHTSHAAKEGSRAGLGLTFMNLGYQMLPNGVFTFGNKTQESRFEPDAPEMYDTDKIGNLQGHDDSYSSNLAGLGEDSPDSLDDSSIFAYALLALGLFIVVKALIGYHRAKRMERVILNPPSTV